jgi:O-antigen ligase
VAPPNNFLTTSGRLVPARQASKRRSRSTSSWFRPSPVEGVKWSLGYASFLVFVFVITSYRLPIGTAAMVATIVGLLISGVRFRVPAALWWMIAFGVWAALGLDTTIYPDRVTAALEDYAKVLVITFAAVNLVRTRPRLRLFIIVFLGTFALYPLRGAFFNYFLYASTMAGRALWNQGYSNPNDLAAFCLPQLAYAVGLIYTERARGLRVAAMVGALLLPFLMILTQSRGGFLGLLVFLIFLLVNQRRRLRTTLLVAAGGLVVAAAAPDSVWTRFSGLTKAADTGDIGEMDSEGSALQRYEIWKVARVIIADHPIAGVGLGAYSAAHFVYAESGPFRKTARGYRDAHSTYFRLLAEVGWVGFFFFAMIVGTTFYHAERIRRRAPPFLRRQAMQLYFIEIGFVGYLVAGVFGSFGTTSFTYIHLALIHCCAEVLRRDSRARRVEVAIPFPAPVLSPLSLANRPIEA